MRRLNAILDITAGIAGLMSAVVLIILEYYWLTAFFLAIFAVAALTGGIYALSGRNWNLYLAASISAVPASPLFGIPALIFTIISRAQFQGGN